MDVAPRDRDYQAQVQTAAKRYIESGLKVNNLLLKIKTTNPQWW